MDGARKPGAAYVVQSGQSYQKWSARVPMRYLAHLPTPCVHSQPPQPLVSIIEPSSTVPAVNIRHLMSQEGDSQCRRNSPFLSTMFTRPSVMRRMSCSARSTVRVVAVGLVIAAVNDVGRVLVRIDPTYLLGEYIDGQSWLMLVVG